MSYLETFSANWDPKGFTVTQLCLKKNEHRSGAHRVQKSSKKFIEQQLSLTDAYWDKKGKGKTKRLTGGINEDFHNPGRN